MHFRTGEGMLTLSAACLTLQSYSQGKEFEERNRTSFLFVWGVMVTSPNETILQGVLFSEGQGQNQDCNRSSCVCSVCPWVHLSVSKPGSLGEKEMEEEGEDM